MSLATQQMPWVERKSVVEMDISSGVEFKYFSSLARQAKSE